MLKEKKRKKEKNNIILRKVLNSKEFPDLFCDTWDIWMWLLRLGGMASRLRNICLNDRPASVSGVGGGGMDGGGQQLQQNKKQCTKALSIWRNITELIQIQT